MDNAFVYELPWISLNNISALKVWSKLLININAYTKIENLKIYYKHLKADHKNSGFTDKSISITDGDYWNEAKWDQGKWDQFGQCLIRIKNLGKSKAIKIKFVDEDNSEIFEIIKMEMFYKILGNVKG